LYWSLKSLGANRSQLLNAIKATRLVAMATRSKPMVPQVMVRYLNPSYLKPLYLMLPYLGNFFRALAVVLVGAPIAFAQVHLKAQVPPEFGAAPKNFIMHETPEPGMALRFEDGDAQPRSLADFRGKVVLLNIWATWCPPCIKEIPALDRLAAALSGADIAVVAVSIDRKGIDAVRKSFADLDVQKLAPYIDQSSQALRTVRSMGMPTSLLIDREGRELGRAVGPAAWDDEATIAFFRQVAAPRDRGQPRYDGIGVEPAR
jgi:thiol-disulfide isomerase/thioredoxin